MAYDRKIVIEFDQDLTNAFSDLTYQVGNINVASSNTAFGSSQYSTSYAYANAFDRSTSTYWRSSSTTMPQYVGTNLGSSKYIGKLRVYLSSYPPNAFILQGSNDSSTYTDVYSGNFTNAAGWQEFTFTPVSYQYWRVYCTSIHSSRCYIYEIELYEVFLMGNQNGFAVTQVEKQADVTANIILTVHNVQKIASNKIQLNINPYSRIKTNEDITVTYSASTSSGFLTGVGGTVQDFTLTFTPTDIVNVPNPWDSEHLSATLNNLDIHTHMVGYKYGYFDEHLSASLSNLSIAVTFVGTVNP